MPERRTLNRTYSVGDQVPTCPVFTRAKIKSRFGILVDLPSQYYRHIYGPQFFSFLWQVLGFYLSFRFVSILLCGLPEGKVHHYHSTYLRVLHISVSWCFSTGVWVTASLLKSQDSSQYSGRSQQCCSLDGLLSSFYFQIFQSLYQSFGDRTEHTNYYSYHRHLHIP